MRVRVRVRMRVRVRVRVRVSWRQLSHDLARVRREHRDLGGGAPRRQHARHDPRDEGGLLGVAPAEGDGEGHG